MILRTTCVCLQVFALAACATGVESTTDIDMRLEPTSHSTFFRQKSSPGKALTSADLIIHSKNIGNFGAVIKIGAVVQYSQVAEGAVVEEVSMPGSSAGYTSREVAVCGLIPVRREVTTDSRSAGAGTTAALAGGTAVPVRMAGMLYRKRYAARTLQTDLNECKATPGMTFRASLEAESQRTVKGTIVNSNRVSVLNVAIRCQAETEALSAASINPTLSGTFLRVNCKTEGGDEFLPVSTVFAYLTDYARFIPLQVDVTSAQSDRLEYLRLSP